MSRSLVLGRHATAEGFSSSDEERSLTARGEAEATAQGRWLSSRKFQPDLVITSSARRTRQTVEFMIKDLGHQPEVWIDQSLYLGGVEAVWEIIRAIPSSVSSVLLVAHNPTVALAAQLLDNGRGGLLGSFSPATFASFDLTAAWDEIDAGEGELIAFAAPES